MHSIYSGIHYNNCNSCKNCNTCTETVQCTDCSNCTTCSPVLTCNTCPEIIPTGVVTNADCNAVSCTEGCEKTIKAECVVLNSYCFVDDCNCNGIPITLDTWLKQMCTEINNIKLDIECLKTYIPSCTTVSTCTTPIITNINDLTVTWIPSFGNTSQSICYKPTGTSLCNTVIVNTFANNYTFTGLIPNQMYDIKIETVCESNVLTSTVGKMFNISENDWSFVTLGMDSLKVNWNFASISNVSNIKLFLYDGATLVTSQIITPSLSSSFIFTGLTTNTNYEIVYGLVYNSAVTFPETYPVDHTFLTPTQSLTEYKRNIFISTF